MNMMDKFFRRPSHGSSPRPHKKAKTDAEGENVEGNMLETTSSVETLKIAGGPTPWSLRRFDLWKVGALNDVTILCKGQFVLKASRLELSVWSERLYILFRGIDADKDEASVDIQDADPTVLEALIRALYELEVSLSPYNAQELLALSDNLQITAVKDVVEQYLVTQLTKNNAVNALFMAEKHNCELLRSAAIPLAAINFETIAPEQLALLPFEDLKELLGSDHLIIADEDSLFSSIKCWSNGPLASKGPTEADDELLSLIDEVRLENIPPPKLNQILDDTWMQQHPKVLRAVAKALVKRTDVMSPRPRKTRAGRVVRFAHWAERLAEAAGQPKPVICSEAFEIDISDASRVACHLQVYPQEPPKAGLQPRIGLYLAIEGEADFPEVSLTLVNQCKPKSSITKEFTKGFKSKHGSLTFWGTKRFVTRDDFEREGFIVDNTVIIRAVPLTERARCMLGSVPRD